MTAKGLIRLAEKDRFALILDERYEQDILELCKELYQLYPCTGILVRQSKPGTAYHVTDRANLQSIAETGLRVTQNDNATYGGGVLYTYPSLENYKYLNPSKHIVYSVVYGPGTLRAVVTYDKDDSAQGEILVPQNCILSYELMQTSTWARTGFDGVSLRQ